jgi:TonB-dependent receptor
MIHKHSLVAVAVATALSFAYGVPASAQSTGPTIVADGAAGTVAGRVKEAARGVYLDGAVVTLNATQVTTERDGSFRITGVSPGRYTLRVDYLGYQGQDVEIEVGDGRGARVEIELRSTVSATDLDRVEVRASRDAQALALNQQRTSGNYVNVVSADLLGQFPDANVAEATQRIPGVSIERDQGEGRYVNVRGAPLEYTSVSVDGVPLAAPNAARRAVELDTIPSDVIAALEVTKALTPNQDGDAIAGSINIRTRSALDRDGLTLRASIAGGEYELGSGANQRANATIGNRFGADGNIGVLVSASTSKAERFTDNVETAFFRNEDGTILPELTEIKDYEGTRTRRSVTGRFDFRLHDDHLLYFIASGSRFKDHEFRDTMAIEYERHTADSTERIGVAGRATFDKELRERTHQQTIRTFNLGGEHFVGDDWRADWQVSHSIGELEVSPRDQYIFRSTVRPQLSYDYSNPDFPVWQIIGVADAPATGVNLPEDWYAFRRLNQRYEYAEEKETGLRLDLSRPQSFLGNTGDIKFGMRARLRDKDSNDDRRRNSSLSDFEALGISYSDMLLPDSWSNNFDYFLTGRRFRRDIFQQYAGPLQQSPNHLLLVADSIVNDYQASEDIHAAYFRLDAQWDKLSLITGLRYERTKTESSAAHFDEENEVATVVEVDNNYDNFLPSVHLRYEFTPDTIFRTSYSTAISRPNYTNIVPRRTFGEYEWDDITEGNPGLKATYSHNFDISIERYLRPLGLVSAALFYKKINDPIFTVNIENLMTDDEGEPVTQTITRPENGDGGEIYGLELTWQQTFDFLPSPFDGFGVYTNYTYADSSADLPVGQGRTELPGTSRHNYNVALAYEKYGLNARLSYNYRSKFIQEFAVGDSDFNVFWDDRSSLDFSASYRIGSQWRVFAEVNNITDERQRRFQGQSNRVLELEGFGRSWLVGVRYDH